MRWTCRIKNLCRRVNETQNDFSSESKRKWMAWKWLAMAFIFTVSSNTHIFEIPFMVFDPKMGKPDQGNNQSFVPINSSDASLTVENMTSSTTARPIIMKRKLKDDLGLITNSESSFTSLDVLKFSFLCGLAVGCFSMGPLIDRFGRKNTFKILARCIIIFGFVMSICRSPYTLAICWFMIGFSCLSIYHMVFINLLEKFADVYEGDKEPDVSDNRNAKFNKYKYRLYLGIGFTCTWNFSRLLSLLVAWVTKDWTLICMWLSIIFSVLYFILGDFFTDEFIDEKSYSDRESNEDKENFYMALKKRPILALNLFIVSFNWFVCCHNLYGLVLGWTKLSLYGNMFDNNVISTCFSYIALPIKFGVCIAAKRKLLPFGLLQLFAGITILAMIAFSTDSLNLSATNKDGQLTSGKIFAAHIANVLISASLGILTTLTMETFPRKYRMHCFGFCSGIARFGTMLGIVISQLGYFKVDAGPAFAGTLAIIAAILTRLLPDLTTSRLPKTQEEIEMEQFPNRRTIQNPS